MADYQWNPLTDEKKFEDLINDLCSKKYGIEFQIYGRKGQKQYGIDGSALTADKKHILHQCKNKMISRSDSAIQSELLKDLETETVSMLLEFIEKKDYILDKFIFANSFKRDTKLQDKATELSVTHGIVVIVWSWDEISDMLEEYTDIAQKYYREFFEIKQKKQEKKIRTDLNQKHRWNRWEDWDRGQQDLTYRIIEKYSYGEYGFHQFKELDDIESIMIDLKEHYDESTKIIQKNQFCDDILHSLFWTRGSSNDHIRGGIEKSSTCDRCWILGNFELKVKSIWIFDNRTSFRANFLILETDSLEGTGIYSDDYYERNYIEEFGIYEDRAIKLNEYDCGWAKIDGKRVNVLSKAERKAKILKSTLFFIAPQGSIINDMSKEEKIDMIIKFYEEQNSFNQELWF